MQCQTLPPPLAVFEFSIFQLNGRAKKEKYLFG